MGLLSILYLMKFILAALATVAAAHNLESGSQFKFMQFIAEHGKSYADAAEYMLRFNLWQKTEDFILANNSGNETHVAGHNSMSDMTKTERSARLGLANVTAVGYGTDADSGEEYFLVKNSWASTWGLNGYVKIGVASGMGICGINQNAYTVSV